MIPVYIILFVIFNLSFGQPPFQVNSQLNSKEDLLNNFQTTKFWFPWQPKYSNILGKNQKLPKNKKRTSSEDNNKMVKKYFHPNSIHSLPKKTPTFEHEEINVETSEVLWGYCSPKVVSSYLCSNVKLKCEMWAPLGTKVNWLKNSQVISSQKHETIQGQNALEFYDFERNFGEYRPSSRSKYEFHLVNLLYLNCFSEKDEGIYTLDVVTPNGKNYSKYFNLKSTGYSRIRFGKCWSCLYEPKYTPRIVNFAWTVKGHEGEAVALPCRTNYPSSVTISWSKKGQKLDPEFVSITEEGDLKFTHLNESDQGMYICELYGYKYKTKYDQVITYLQVLN